MGGSQHVTLQYLVHKYMVSFFVLFCVFVCLFTFCLPFSVTCQLGEFTCDDMSFAQICLHGYQLCDLRILCHDGSDEENCGKSKFCLFLPLFLFLFVFLFCLVSLGNLFLILISDGVI